MKPIAILLLVFAIGCADNTKGESVADKENAVSPKSGTLSPTPAIDWANWGTPCDAHAYGLISCTGIDGTIGLCKRVSGATDPDGDGLYAGTCDPACFAEPPFDDQCPSDAHVLNLGDGQGCTCEKK